MTMRPKPTALRSRRLVQLCLVGLAIYQNFQLVQLKLPMKPERLVHLAAVRMALRKSSHSWMPSWWISGWYMTGCMGVHGVASVPCKTWGCTVYEILASICVSEAEPSVYHDYKLPTVCGNTCPVYECTIWLWGYRKHPWLEVLAFWPAYQVAMLVEIYKGPGMQWCSQSWDPSL